VLLCFFDPRAKGRKREREREREKERERERERKCVRVSICLKKMRPPVALGSSPELFAFQVTMWLKASDIVLAVDRGLRGGNQMRGEFSSYKAQVLVGTQIRLFEFGVKYLNFGAT